MFPWVQEAPRPLFSPRERGLSRTERGILGEGIKNRKSLSGSHAPAWEQACPDTGGISTLQRHETLAAGAAPTAFPRRSLGASRQEAPLPPGEGLGRGDRNNSPIPGIWIPASQPDGLSGFQAPALAAGRVPTTFPRWSVGRSQQELAANPGTSRRATGTPQRTFPT